MNISDITNFIKYKSTNKKLFYLLEAVLKLIDVDINVLHKK